MPIWIVALVAFAAGIASGGETAHIYYKGVLAQEHLQQEKAKARAISEATTEQQRLDHLSTQAAVDQAAAQVKTITKTLTITKEIPRYVTEIHGCPTFGFVRVLDARALGADPEDLQLPAGKSNDDCAPISFGTLAENIVRNYGTADSDADQLDGLESWELKRQASPP